MCPRRKGTALATVAITTYNKYGPSVLPEGVPNAGGVMSSRSSDHVLVAPNGRRFGFVYSEADTWMNRGEGLSRIFITEPHAALYGLPSVIDNYGGTGAEIKRNREAGTEHDVAPGDLIVTDGSLVFRAIDNPAAYDRTHYPLAIEYVGTVLDLLAEAVA